MYVKGSIFTHTLIQVSTLLMLRWSEESISEFQSVSSLEELIRAMPLSLLMSGFNHLELHKCGLKCLWHHSKTAREITDRLFIIENKWVIINIKRLLFVFFIAAAKAPFRIPCDHLDLKLMQMIHNHCTGSYLLKQTVTQRKRIAYLITSPYTDCVGDTELILPSGCTTGDKW